MKESFIEYLNEYPSAWKGHYLLAYDIVKTFRPNITVDLGVDYGHSTFALAYPKIGEVTGVDWFQGDIHTGIRDTAEIVLERYTKSKENYNILKYLNRNLKDVSTIYKL